MTVREATPADVPAILGLIRELAEYERALDEVRTTEADLAEHLFRDSPAAFCHVAVAADGEVVGMALWFLTYSTWTGVHGLHLEDLYVRPGSRGTGLGRALLATLAQVCTDRGYQRLEWKVLDWNTPAIGFYESLAAVPQAEWTTYRLDGDPLRVLAHG